ncbi:MAG: chitinase [Acidobacteria bacterium]|nr:MAG: chitinase [Acidobacteriota bacterium]
MTNIRGLLLTLLITPLPIADAPASAQTSVGSVVSSSQYGKLLPRRDAFYGYDHFVAGGNAVPGFCTTGDAPTRIRECAAFLANMAHETAGGRYVAEIGRKACPNYCDATQTGPCGLSLGQSYYGRGPLQISWNYNYCGASKFIYGDDGSTLVKDPGILEKDAATSTQASLWYWMTQSGTGTMSAHDCMTSDAGFGCTIRSINGTLECDGHNRAEVRSRVNNYLLFLRILGNGKVRPVGRNDC